MSFAMRMSSQKTDLILFRALRTAKLCEAFVNGKTPQMGDQTHLRCFCQKGERENEKQVVSDHEFIITAEFVFLLNIMWGFR